MKKKTLMLATTLMLLVALCVISVSATDTGYIINEADGFSIEVLNGVANNEVSGVEGTVYIGSNILVVKMEGVPDGNYLILVMKDKDADGNKVSFPPTEDSVSSICYINQLTVSDGTAVATFDKVYPDLSGVKKGDQLNLYFITPDGKKDGSVIYYLSYIVGDVDGNDTVNGRDRMVLARYLAGWDGYESQVNMAAADIDGNGTVNGRDRMILARYLAGWDGYDTYFS